MNKHWFFILILSIGAMLLAGTAAWFSVFGLTQLFYGAGIGITILAASLEFAKVVTVSYVYRFWKSIEKALRGFYIFAVVFIMFLTSMGIYGFLISGYQKSANKVQLRDAQIKISENKKTLFVNQLERINKTIESDNNRINVLSGVRTSQERRIDTLYQRKMNSDARGAQKYIGEQNEQLKILNQDITDKMKQSTTVNDSIAFYDQKIAESKASEVSNEISSYQFIADLTGIPMNKVVNFVALVIIFVFDPLAIALLIAVNRLTMNTEDRPDNEMVSKIGKFFRRKKKEEEEIIEKIEEEPIKPEEPKISWNPVFNEPEIIEEPEEIVDNKPEDPKKNSISEGCQDGYEERKIELIKDNIKDDLKVYHDVFGEGHIVKSDLLKNRVFVQFESGVKELYLDFANLKEIRCIKKDDVISEPYLDFFADDPDVEPYQSAPEIIEPQPVPVINEKEIIEQPVIEPIIEKEIIEQPVIEPVVESQKKKKFFQNLLTNLKKSTLLIRKNS